RSAEIAPSTTFPVLMGTEMKAMSFFRRPERAPVRFRNWGSWETRGTTAGLPLWMTLPVTPSPSRYRPFSFWLSDSPWAASIEISPVSRFTSASVPRTISMWCASASRTGPTTSRRSMLRSRIWLISTSSWSSFSSRLTDVVRPSVLMLALPRATVGEAGNEIPTTMYPEGREPTLMSGDLSSAIQSALAREVHGQIDSGEPAQEHDQQDELEQTEVVPLL